MFRQKLSLLLAFVFVFCAVEVQADTEVECDFHEQEGEYWCEFFGLTISDDESQKFVITGTHLPNKTNEDVLAVLIFYSDVPFIISEFFTTFPKMILLGMYTGGLRKIQPNAFDNAGSLLYLDLVLNNFTTIPPAAFLSMSNADEIFLRFNFIEFIHENAFLGLPLLYELDLTGNVIRELPDNVFRPLVRLDRIYLTSNRFETLSGKIFTHNQVLEVIVYDFNAINAIERGFFDRVHYRGTFRLISNRCVDWDFWMNTLEQLNEGLRLCYENFERLE